MNRLLSTTVAALLTAFAASAQSVTKLTTTESQPWQQSRTSLESKTTSTPVLEIEGSEKGVELRAWGTTFNELDC